MSEKDKLFALLHQGVFGVIREQHAALKAIWLM